MIRVMFCVVLFAAYAFLSLYQRIGSDNNNLSDQTDNYSSELPLKEDPVVSEVKDSRKNSIQKSAEHWRVAVWP
jgi:hypothetical protein